MLIILLVFNSLSSDYLSLYLYGTHDPPSIVSQENNLIMQHNLDGPVSAIANYDLAWAGSQSQASSSLATKQIIYGTSNGILGQCLLSGADKSSRSGWLVHNDDSFQGEINCMSTAFDMTKDGVNDVLVGRDDGLVQVYSFDMQTRGMYIYRERNKALKR